MKKQTFTTIAALTGCTALAIHGINKLIFYTANLKDSLSDTSGSYYEWRFGRIYYKVYGSGSPLLLIHDLSASGSGHEWYKLVEDLSKSHTVYVLDLPGCGRSKKNNITYTNYIYVQLISDFIKNVIKHRTTVAATGLSSSFVIMACYTNEDLFDKLIFINPTNIKELALTPSKSTKTLKLLLECPLIGTLMYNMLTAKNMIEEAFEEDYYFDTSKIREEDISLYYESAHKHGAKSRFLLSSLKGRYLNLNIIHGLKEINHSMYLFYGEEYQPAKEALTDYLTYNPSIETFSIAETRYLPQLENPKAVLEQLHLVLES